MGAESTIRAVQFIIVLYYWVYKIKKLRKYLQVLIWSCVKGERLNRIYLDKTSFVF